MSTIPVVNTMSTIPVVSADDAPPQAMGSPSRTAARPMRDETLPEPSLDVVACPLQTAMRQVAEAAVTQHVLYAEGVYRPREGLLHEMQAWLRLHELVRTGICPATRTGSGAALEPGDLEIALASVPVALRAQVATSLRVCGRRSRGEGCPLAALPQPADSLMR
ncbi:MAG TPA: hypothetical protein VF116_04040 [Ktedonobacterales bacterium]